MIPGDVNLVAVVAAAALSIVIGMLWYSALFGNAWMREAGIKKKDIEKAKKKGMAKEYTFMTLAALVLAYMLANFVEIVGASTFLAGMQVGFWLWLGFVATIMINAVLWEQKSGKYYLINVSYQLVSLALAGGLLAVWP